MVHSNCHRYSGYGITNLGRWGSRLICIDDNVHFVQSSPIPRRSKCKLRLEDWTHHTAPTMLPCRPVAVAKGWGARASGPLVAPAMLPRRCSIRSVDHSCLIHSRTPTKSQHQGSNNSTLASHFWCRHRGDSWKKSGGHTPSLVVSSQMRRTAHCGDLHTVPCTLARSLICTRRRTRGLNCLRRSQSLALEQKALVRLGGEGRTGTADT